jgi:hypothetical protein
VTPDLAGFPSGQRGRTVNPLAQPSKVRILLPPPCSTTESPAHAGLSSFRGALDPEELAGLARVDGGWGKRRLVVQEIVVVVTMESAAPAWAVAMRKSSVGSRRTATTVAGSGTITARSSSAVAISSASRGSTRLRK